MTLDKYEKVSNESKPYCEREPDTLFKLMARSGDYGEMMFERMYIQAYRKGKDSE